MALDGIYIDDSNGDPEFRRVGPPTDAEVARVAQRVHRRVLHLMEQRSIGPQADTEEADALRRDEPLLADLYGASITGRVATGPRAGKRIVKVGDGPDFEKAVMKPGQCCASVEGFSVHAGECPSKFSLARGTGFQEESDWWITNFCGAGADRNKVNFINLFAEN
jgi:hypothetical protein